MSDYLSDLFAEWQILAQEYPRVGSTIRKEGGAVNLLGGGMT